LPTFLEVKLMTLMRLDELRQLGEDIKANGMKVPIILLHEHRGLSLVDGPNRLDALKAVGFDVPALFEACLEGKPDPEAPTAVRRGRRRKIRGAAR
jgi:ParB-like chromosome segregation protein Spo0J